jgi:hypothetical protein
MAGTLWPLRLESPQRLFCVIVGNSKLKVLRCGRHARSWLVIGNKRLTTNPAGQRTLHKIGASPERLFNR